MRLSVTRLTSIANVVANVQIAIYYALLYTETGDQLTTQTGDALIVPLSVP